MSAMSETGSAGARFGDKPDQRKVLCLHGFGQSEDIFGLYLHDLQKHLPGCCFDVMQGSYQLSSEEDWECLDHGAGEKGSALAEVGRAGRMQLFGYFPLRASHTLDMRGQPEFKGNAVEATGIAQRVLEKVVAEGYEGIIGFSTGGSVAMLVLERLSTAPGSGLKWVATFGSTSPFTDMSIPATRGVPGTRLFMCCGMATDHIGLKDAEAFRDAKTVKSALEPLGVQVELYTHSGFGHEMPAGEAARQVYSHLRWFINVSEAELKPQQGAPELSPEQQEQQSQKLTTAHAAASTAATAVRALAGRIDARTLEIVGALELDSVKAAQGALRRLRAKMGRSRTDGDSEVQIWLLALMGLLGCHGYKRVAECNPLQELLAAAEQQAATKQAAAQRQTEQQAAVEQQVTQHIPAPASSSQQAEPMATQQPAAAQQQAELPAKQANPELQVALALVAGLRTKLEQALLQSELSDKVLAAIEPVDAHSRFGVVQKAVRDVKADRSPSHANACGNKLALEWLMALLKVLSIGS